MMKMLEVAFTCGINVNKTGTKTLKNKTKNKIPVETLRCDLLEPKLFKFLNIRESMLFISSIDYKKLFFVICHKLGDIF